MIRRFCGICSTSQLKMDNFFNVLQDTFDQKLAFAHVVYFREERQVRLGRNLIKRTCVLCLVMISYTESNARYHREDQIKSKEALFGQESFVHGLKC